MFYKSRLYLPVLALVVLLGVACNNDQMSNSEAGSSSSDLSYTTLDKSDNGSEATTQSFGGLYKVTITNLAPATGPGASQPLSPPVLATHAPNFRIFHIGGLASDEIRQVAEDAVNGPLIALLNGSDKVFEVQTGGGVILPGESASVMINSEKGYHKISFVSMLVNTNDGFTGMDKASLPKKGSKTYHLRSYDAGTEKNTELDDHIPGPCCGSPGVRVPTEERIRHHKGIEGTGDLDPSVYDWDEPIAKVVIERMN